MSLAELPAKSELLYEGPAFRALRQISHCIGVACMNARVRASEIQADANEAFLTDTEIEDRAIREIGAMCYGCAERGFGMDEQEDGSLVPVVVQMDLAEEL